VYPHNWSRPPPKVGDSGDNGDCPRERSVREIRICKDCDDHDAHDDVMQGFSKGGAVLSSELKGNVKGGNLEAQALQSAMRARNPGLSTPPPLSSHLASVRAGTAGLARFSSKFVLAASSIYFSGSQELLPLGFEPARYSLSNADAGVFRGPVLSLPFGKPLVQLLQLREGKDVAIGIEQRIPPDALTYSAVFSGPSS
jgi:hypothetical protein